MLHILLTMSQVKSMYIYNLPYAEMKDLCRILDQNDKWMELAGTHMGYDNATIQVKLLT